MSMCQAKVTCHVISQVGAHALCHLKVSDNDKVFKRHFKLLPKHEQGRNHSSVKKIKSSFVLISLLKSDICQMPNVYMTTSAKLLDV